jgi:hypothetical protein
MSDDLGLLLDAIFQKRAIGYDFIFVTAKRVARQGQKYPLLVLPDMDQFVYEQPLKRHIAIAEIVAKKLTFGMEPEMPVGGHGDLAGLKPPPFAVVDSHPFIINCVLENAAGQSTLAFGQPATRWVWPEHGGLMAFMLCGIGKGFDRCFDQNSAAIGKNKFHLDFLKAAGGQVDAKKHRMFSAALFDANCRA